MIGRLWSAATGLLGGYAWQIVAAAGAALVVLVFWYRAEMVGARADAAALRVTVALRDAALAETKRERDSAVGALEERARLAAALAPINTQLRRIANAATGTACVASPGVAAYLDGLRQQPAGGRGGAAPAAR